MGKGMAKIKLYGKVLNIVSTKGKKRIFFKK